MTRFLLVLAAGLCLAAPSLAAPLEAYGRLPTIEAVDISPDGQMVAAVATDGEQRVVNVSRISDGVRVAGVRAGNVKVRNVLWVGSRHVVVAATIVTRADMNFSPRREYLTVFDLDVTTGKSRQLMPEGREGRNVLYAAANRFSGGRATLVLTGRAYARGRTGDLAFFRFDLDKDGPPKVTTAEVPNVIEWVLDAGGEPVAEASYDEQARKWTLRTRKDGDWSVSKVLTTNWDHPNLFGLGRDPGTILVRSRNTEDHVFQEVSLRDGAWSDPLPMRGVQRLLRNPVTHTLAGYSRLVGDDHAVVYFDPAEQRVWDAIARAYPGQQVTPFVKSQDGLRQVVLVESPSDSPALALVDLNTKRADWLGMDYPDLHRMDVGETRPLQFTARDGLPLSGYLTLPQGRAGTNLPLVVMPHDGPGARDDSSFDWWAQALASRGYAVLKVNFRGSYGFGTDFLNAGRGQWGRKMQSDLSDGVRYLAAKGIIDPKRVCIVGASYGGYAALAGATLESGVYRCAASVAGMADLKKFVVFSDQNGGDVQRYWLEFIGAKSPSDPILRELSPVDLADKVEIPILLVHGRDDTVVPLTQSQQMADALRRAGKTVDLVVMEGEDHWLTKGATRQRMLKAVVEFLEKNNPPG